MSNSVWKYDTGWLCAYTEDRELIRKIKRSRKDWTIMADYFKGNYLVGCQFKIPIEQRRAVERLFGVTENEEKEAI